MLKSLEKMGIVARTFDPWKQIIFPVLETHGQVVYVQDDILHEIFISLLHPGSGCFRGYIEQLLHMV